MTVGYRPTVMAAIQRMRLSISAQPVAREVVARVVTTRSLHIISLARTRITRSASVHKIVPFAIAGVAHTSSSRSFTARISHCAPALQDRDLAAFADHEYLVVSSDRRRVVLLHRRFASPHFEDIARLGVERRS